MWARPSTEGSFADTPKSAAGNSNKMLILSLKPCEIQRIKKRTQLDLAVLRDKQIAGFDISMDNRSFCVTVVESSHGVVDNARNLLLGERSFERAIQRVEGPAAAKLHTNLRECIYVKFHYNEDFFNVGLMTKSV